MSDTYGRGRLTGTLRQGLLGDWSGGRGAFNAPQSSEAPLLGPSFSGVPQRALYPGEDQYFRANPNVGGMATEDSRVIINPHSPLSGNERAAVGQNEAARVMMRNGQAPAPQFDLTPAQGLMFGGYSQDPQDQRDTIAARLLSGDPSAGAPTMEQLDYRGRLAQLLSGGSGQ